MNYDMLKFAIIILCVLIAATNKDYAVSKKDSILLTAGLLATLVADFFLVILYVYPAGVLFFCAVQILYVARFGGKRALMLTPLVVVLPIVFFTISRDLLIAVALGYAQLFILSYTCMIRAIKRGMYAKPNAILIVLGMTLFVLCDLSVAIWNLWRMEIIANESLAILANDAIWLFYAPSQVCLALSGHKFTKRRLATNGGN